MADKQKEVKKQVNFDNMGKDEFFKYVKSQGFTDTDILNYKNDNTKMTGPMIEKMTEYDPFYNSKASGGSITKNRMGGNDYRKGGYVLNTTDKRKVKRNGK